MPPAPMLPVPYSGENHLIDRNREPHQRRQCRPRSEHQPWPRQRTRTL